ncbi:MAG: hypothetical protein QJR03_01085 [Sphaerobacter sp.]|nr:hypothetical protein [Sphaerobacter sp.]
MRKVGFNEADGDHVMMVELDKQYEHLLRPGNHGSLVVKVIATDEPTVYIPEVGEHATFYGALVLDREHDNWVAIHPCWLITTDTVTGLLEPRRSRRVEIEAPDEVAVGDPWPVIIRVLPLAGGADERVTGVHLFLELVSAGGEAVRWKAAWTNMLGQATVPLAALVRAGTYTLQVYAAMGRNMGRDEARLRVRRR